MHIKIGTRSSKLAIAQAQRAADLLSQLGHTYELITILTSGDKIKDKNLYDIGGKALFLKEIEEALLAKQIDLAVHSFKDVPGRIPAQLTIAAVLERKTPNDMLLSFDAKTIMELPHKAKVGTSSVRRKSILLHHRPDLEIANCRGNITLRIKKFLDKEYDAIILAACGLEMLGMIDPSYCSVIPHEEMLPAVAQGTVAIEVRKNDLQMIEICKNINHQLTWQLLKAERSFLKTLDADCRTPLAAFAQLDNNKVIANFMLADISGLNLRTYSETVLLKEAQALGIKAAKILSAQ